MQNSYKPCVSSGQRESTNAHSPFDFILSCFFSFSLNPWPSPGKSAILHPLQLPFNATSFSLGVTE